MRYTTAILAATAAAVTAKTYPAEFSVDFLTPLTEGPFKRAYPFPVLFAIKGKPEVWPHDLKMLIQLERDGDDFVRESVDLNLTTIVGKLPSEQDTFFGVVGMFSAVDAPAEGGSLVQEVSFWQYCEDIEAAGRANETEHDTDYDTEFESDYDGELEDETGAVGKRGLDNYPGLASMSGSFLDITFDDEKGADPVLKPKIKGGCETRKMTVLIKGKESDRCLLYEPDYDESDKRDCTLEYPKGYEAMVEKKLKELEACGDDTRPGSAGRIACNAMPILLEADEGDEKDKDDTDKEKDKPEKVGDGNSAEATDEKPSATDDDKSGASVAGGMSWFLMLAVPAVFGVW